MWNISYHYIQYKYIQSAMHGKCIVFKCSKKSFTLMNLLIWGQILPSYVYILPVWKFCSQISSGTGLLLEISVSRGSISHGEFLSTLCGGMITQHSEVDWPLNLSTPWQRSAAWPSWHGWPAEARRAERGAEGRLRRPRPVCPGAADLGPRSIWIRKCLLHRAEYQLGCYYGAESERTEGTRANFSLLNVLKYRGW